MACVTKRDHRQPKLRILTKLIQFQHTELVCLLNEVRDTNKQGQYIEALLFSLRWYYTEKNTFFNI